jgi:predicted kinase
MFIALAGLPGTGKSTIGQVVAARLGIPVVSVDPIETAILQAGIDSDQPTGLAAYLVAETLAERVLESGSGVMVDAVNAVAPAREQWVSLANRLEQPLRFIEVICSDPELHRSRIEQWRRSMPHIQLTWNAVEQSFDDYAEWAGPSAAVGRITLDSVEPLGVNVDRAIAFLES